MDFFVPLAVNVCQVHVLVPIVVVPKVDRKVVRNVKKMLDIVRLVKPIITNHLTSVLNVLMGQIV